MMGRVNNGSGFTRVSINTSHQAAWGVPGGGEIRPQEFPAFHTAFGGRFALREGGSVSRQDATGTRRYGPEGDGGKPDGTGGEKSCLMGDELAAMLSDS